MTVDGSRDAEALPARRIHREILQLISLVLIALIAFGATRAVAAHARRVAIADGASWYERGQRSLAAGDASAAIDAFRRATTRNRGQRTYALALARALEYAGDTSAAERALLALRESAPEDSEINLELARLAAGQRREDALRYYRNALYAPLSAADPGARRAVRLELIRFLLDHDDRSRALGELLAAVADSPNTTASAVQLGQLLLKAGDDRRAADQFAQALRHTPRNRDALAGAGSAAFHLAHYADARRYLAAVDTTEARDLREVADLVITNDPLAPRLGYAERRRRLAADLRAVAARLQTCGAADASTLAKDLETFAARLRRQDARNDPDQIETGIDLVERGEQGSSACGTPSSLDRALVLIARLHGAVG